MWQEKTPNLYIKPSESEILVGSMGFWQYVLLAVWELGNEGKCWF